MVRVLVCGGRDYLDRERLFYELDRLRPTMSGLISGGAPGADTLAWDWGWSRGIQCERFMADWKTHGKAAGPIRNQKMLDEGKPDIVLAFPGGRGTSDMITRAKRSGVRVVEVDVVTPTRG